MFIMIEDLACDGITPNVDDISLGPEPVGYSEEDPPTSKEGMVEQEYIQESLINYFYSFLGNSVVGFLVIPR